MRELTKTECERVSGGFWWIAASAAAGAGIGVYNYRKNKMNREEPITVSGILIAAAFGAVTSGFGSAATAAVGGGVAATAVIMPKQYAVNYIGQQIVAAQGLDEEMVEG